MVVPVFGEGFNMAAILIVEDDANARLLTKLQLNKNYIVLEAGDGVVALEVLAHHCVDLIVSDAMMPRMDGYEFVRRLREMNNTVPIIMLTARRGWEDKRTGFSLGADDYMTKPLNYEELMWRIQALLRRTKMAGERTIILGEVSIDADRYTVARGNEVQELPKKEFELLHKLLSYPGIVFTKLQLLDDIWGYDSESDESTIKTHISRLRHRFACYEEFSIVTVRGLGYKGEIHIES